jgi:hypothetical protein
VRASAYCLAAENKNGQQRGQIYFGSTKKQTDKLIRPLYQLPLPPDLNCQCGDVCAGSSGRLDGGEAGSKTARRYTGRIQQKMNRPVFSIAAHTTFNVFYPAS